MWPATLSAFRDKPKWRELNSSPNAGASASIELDGIAFVRQSASWSSAFTLVVLLATGSCRLQLLSWHVLGRWDWLLDRREICAYQPRRIAVWRQFLHNRESISCIFMWHPLELCAHVVSAVQPTSDQDQKKAVQRPAVSSDRKSSWKKEWPRGAGYERRRCPPKDRNTTAGLPNMFGKKTRLNTKWIGYVTLCNVGSPRHGGRRSSYPSLPPSRAETWPDIEEKVRVRNRRREFTELLWSTSSGYVLAGITQLFLGSWRTWQMGLADTDWRRTHCGKGTHVQECETDVRVNLVSQLTMVVRLSPKWSRWCRLSWTHRTVSGDFFWRHLAQCGSEEIACRRNRGGHGDGQVSKDAHETPIFNHDFSWFGLTCVICGRPRRSITKWSKTLYQVE